MEVKFKGADHKEFITTITEEEAQFLVEFAITELVRRGALTVADQNAKDEQDMMDYLESIPEEDMHSA